MSWSLGISPAACRTGIAHTGRDTLRRQAAALPAFVVTLLLQGLAIVTAPVRLLRRLLGRPAGTAGAG